MRSPPRTYRCRRQGCAFSTTRKKDQSGHARRHNIEERRSARPEGRGPRRSLSPVAPKPSGPATPISRLLRSGRQRASPRPPHDPGARPLRVTNMVLTGKCPFARRFSDEDFELIVNQGRLHWEVIGENGSPLLQARIEKKELNMHGKPKHACVSFWHGGVVNVVGVTTRKEASHVYDLAVKDIRRVLGRKR